MVADLREIAVEVVVIVDLGESVQGVVEVADRDALCIYLTREVSCRIIRVRRGAGIRRDDLVGPSFVVVAVCGRVGFFLLHGGQVIIRIVSVNR